ncbi:RNA-binding protein [Sporothrix brasiliensis 5110]|uniref:RNA-binding protein n=1 Tax=Sporothrix brasiliensis 5110 TaxID=1398154 RepID=A0A0C2ITM6_9PEZI|nr:RNA-binding protein [Sporothrix brasiliensis 5110]KIH90125.1 RNA-binding protein [Sporothrix brasiliensis 5110]
MTGFQQNTDTGMQNRRSGVASGYVNNTGSQTDVGLHPHQGAALGSGIQAPDDGLSAIMGQFSALNLPTSGLGQPGPTMHSLPPGAFVNGPNGSIVFATPYPGSIHPLLADHGYGTAAYPMQYPTGGYAQAYGHGAMMPFTPGRPMAYGDRIPRELPVLENRRGSYSTSATESAPATPFFGHAVERLNGGTRVASLERSSYTTPSPREAGSFGNASMKVVPDPDVERLLMQEPPIPKAVPAVWTDHVKSLEQCLENRIQGNRNVYIRGLHPTTDDGLLLKYTERFGDVEQSKAIIDTATGACKGFGFAKFKDVKDSEKCIRGFYRRGYEVGFARESFNARLKAEGDESSTNLYISNLPKDINESTLSQIFEPFHIVSSKILRDTMGNSRGVGFARFESRDICEQVIKNFHGMTIGQDHFNMQVRYADTPSQKELKRITSERRQYRTNEYNIGAYGTHAVGINPSIYAPAPWSRRSQGTSGLRYID